MNKVDENLTIEYHIEGEQCIMSVTQSNIQLGDHLMQLTCRTSVTVNQLKQLHRIQGNAIKKYTKHADRQTELTNSIQPQPKPPH